MNRTEAIKKVWSLVELDKIKEAEEIARKYDIEMCFGDCCITLEDDVFLFLMKESKIDNGEAVETYVKSDIIALNKLYSEKVGE